MPNVGAMPPRCVTRDFSLVPQPIILLQICSEMWLGLDRKMTVSNLDSAWDILEADILCSLPVRQISKIKDAQDRLD
jgi:hypothetical protein